MGIGRGWVVLAAVGTMGADCDRDRPPTVGPSPTFDAGLDAALDATPEPGDAAPDAPWVSIPGDTCEDPVDIRAAHEPDEDGAYHIVGNLDDFRNDVEPCGGFNRDTDAVYVYVPPSDGQLRTALGNESYADLAVQTDCHDADSTLSCVGYPGFGCSVEPCGRVDPVLAGAPVFLIVDGRFTTARDYTLTVQHYPWAREGDECVADDLARTCAPTLLCRAEDDGPGRCRAMTCGDGLVEGDLFAGPGEECDDGNTDPGDGCGAACSLEEQGPGGEACADATPFRIVPTNPSLFLVPYGFAASDTSSASADLEGSCAASATSADQVWLLEVAEATALTIGVTPRTEGFQPLLYLLADDGAGSCGDTELGCEAGEPATGAALTFESLDPGTYFLVVDGLDGEAVSAGAYTLEAAAGVY